MNSINNTLQAVRDQCFGGSGDRSEAKNVAIVITDGVPYPTNRRQPAIDEAETLRMENSKSEVLNPLNFEFDF